jgi:4-cresol dehydrogenase (hydroxylating)
MPTANTNIEISEDIATELRAIVGPEHVSLGADELARYSRCTIPWQRQCAAVIFPGSAEEVAGIMRIATRHRLPVWPFSKGRNWGYGTTLALEGGTLIMVLERMNRILEVNVELAYAVIEPGVTYEQLNAHLKQLGDELWIDCIDGSAQGSVIGNALERGVGETPYGDHFGNLCGLEVVLPDGDTVQVGGSANGLHTWHTHKWGIGPYLEGLFSQSNLGIVTKAGIWLMPKPEAYNSYVFEIGDERHLPDVLDAFRKLALQGVVSTKLHMINDFVSLTILTQRISEDVSSGGRLSAVELDKLRHKYGIAPWACGGGIYGTRAQVRLQRSLLRKALGRYGRLVFLSDRLLTLFELLIAWCRRSAALRLIVKKLAGASLPLMESAPHVHRILQGIPTEFFVKHAYYRNRQARPDDGVDPARDRCGLMWFAPILPFDKGFILPYLDACKRSFDGRGFDFYVAMLLMNPRSVICLMAIMYDKDDADEVARAEQLYAQLLADMRGARFQQYRAGLLSWDTIFENAPGLQRLHERIKAALDGANVLAPGRYGIGRSRAK